MKCAFPIAIDAALASLHRDVRLIIDSLRKRPLCALAKSAKMVATVSSSQPHKVRSDHPFIVRARTCLSSIIKSLVKPWCS